MIAGAFGHSRWNGRSKACSKSGPEPGNAQVCKDHSDSLARTDERLNGIDGRLKGIGERLTGIDKFLRDKL